MGLGGGLEFVNFDIFFTKISNLKKKNIFSFLFFSPGGGGGGGGGGDGRGQRGGH